MLLIEDFSLAVPEAEIQMYGYHGTPPLLMGNDIRSISLKCLVGAEAIRISGMCWGMRTKRCKERDVDGSVVSDLERQ
jgi:hypothetical protein